MPLNVILAINEKPIQYIRISRQEKLKAKDRLYTYVVQAHDITATFTHRYSDGAEECVRRALEALAAKRWEEGDDVVSQPQG